MGSIWANWSEIMEEGAKKGGPKEEDKKGVIRQGERGGR